MNSTERPIDRGGFFRKVLGALGGGISLGAFARRAEAAPQAISNYTGEILPWAGSFAPTGWAFCNGQLLDTTQYDQLFNVIGTTYGGDGIVAFALPDLRGRLPLHMGQGLGLTNRTIGQRAGEEGVVLTTSTVPSHSHQFQGKAGNGSSANPSAAVPAQNPAGALQYGAGADATLDPGAILPSGQDYPHNNMQPYLAINYIICLNGVFPSQF